MGVEVSEHEADEYEDEAEEDLRLLGTVAMGSLWIGEMG